jgi:hypothetical protein
MVLTHQISCCESSMLLIIHNSLLFQSSSSIPRPFSNRHFSLLTNRCCLVVLETLYEVMFFIFVIPSEIYRFKFALSCLCDDLIAVEIFVVIYFRKRSMTATFSRCRRTTIFPILPFSHARQVRWVGIAFAIDTGVLA